MKLVLACGNCLLLRDDDSIIYPLSKFISDKFSNPHTRDSAARSLRIFYRFCCAHGIELAELATQGRCLAYIQAKDLARLCYRPLTELESLSYSQIRRINSAKAGKSLHKLKNAVEPNTATKRLNHIAAYLRFFREVFLDPNLRSSTLREQLRQEYEKIAHQLETEISGTKQGHHHDIKSLPTDKFLAVIRAVFTQPEELFLSENGKVSRTLLRDRAMVLLACECLRPGTLGNIARADFRPRSSHLAITDNRSKRLKITSSTPVLKLGASTLVNSASETMIELWPFTVEAIRNYVDLEREAVLSRHLKNRSQGFLFLSETGGPLKHRDSITNLFDRLGQRLAQLGLLDIGDDPYFKAQAQYDFYGYVLRHSSASLFLAAKGTDAQALESLKTRFGWAMNSKQPQRYAARTLSDQANVDLTEFNAGLMAAVREKYSLYKANDGL
jgi:integrase